MLEGMRTKSVSWCSQPVNIPGVSYREYESEFALNVFCADWLRKQYVITGQEKFNNWHHSANERIGARAGMRAKMMGQSKGFPDLVHCGLKIAIEFKVGDGIVSVEQRGWLDYFVTIGWTSAVCRTAEEFWEVIGLPSRQGTCN
jgi:hypothetical protein